MPAALDALVADLHRLFGSEPSGREISTLLRDYAAKHDDWREYAFFADDCYTRNLIESNERFELILLCWASQQCSPVHNHEGQNCWMAVLDGAMEEQRFTFPTGGGIPQPGETCELGPGEVAFIRDEMGLHVVRPTAPEGGVSLHLYASPIPECNCYCEETGAVTRRTLAFHSVRGRLVTT